VKWALANKFQAAVSIAPHTKKPMTVRGQPRAKKENYSGIATITTGDK
jgi:hypothetical protein